MKLSLISFGRLKNPGFEQVASHYLKNLSRWAQIEQIELKPFKVDAQSDGSRAAAQSRETTLIQTTLEKKIGAPYQLILLDETGKSLNSLEWSHRTQKWKESSGMNTVLLIGSSSGFNAEAKSMASEVLSLGPQTLSHELARLVLLEQLYRAISINMGHPYHNA